MAVSRINEAGLNVNQYGNRNIIINGNFTISQRGDYTSSTSVSDGNYYLDRWEYVEDGSPTSSLIHNTDGTVRITTGASVTGSSRLRQKFEYDKFPRQYDNQTFTVSAKIKSNSTNARINVYAGGYLSLTGTTAHSGGGSFETLTATFTTPSTISTEFSVHIGIDGASSANVSITSGEYFEVKEIQMERGDTATDFEHRTFADELIKCQRYYTKFFETGGSGSNAYLRYGYGTCENTTRAEIPINSHTVMRADPTLETTGTFSNYALWQRGSIVALTNLTVEGSGHSNGQLFTLTATVASGLNAGDCVGLLNNNSTTAYLAFDAEL